MRWIRTYRERRALLAVARLLATVDGVAGERRLPARRAGRLSLGARA
ncbi:MAG: hypothetical protein ACM33B_12550 [Pseudomonadota bacterium]